MRLLIVTYKYAPSADPRAFRWTSIAEHWAAGGHDVDVVCAWEPGLPEKEARGGVAVHRVGGPALQVMRKRLAGGEDPEDTRGRRHAGSALLRSVRGMIDKTAAKVFWPDYAWTWYFPARREALGLLGSAPRDAVISVSVPFTGHLVGMHLKDNAPGIPWIVDIGDPFSLLRDVYVNNPLLYGRLNRFIEGKVLAGADAVTVTTERTRGEYLGRFPACSGKIRVIPPLFSIPEDRRGGERVFAEDDRIRMVYVGTLYRAIRNPAFLLRLFTGLLRSGLGPRLELHLFGSVNDCGELFDPYGSLVGRRIFLHGTVERATVYRAMREADILVNIGNSNPCQLPSKVVEYAGTGKPVLNLVRLEDDSSAEFFGSYGACMNVFDEGGAVGEETLAGVVRFLETAPAVDPERNRAFLSRYRVDAISDAYAEVISSLKRG